MSQGSPVRSPGEVSVADRARVALWTSVLAWAWRRLSSAAGCLRSDGWALAIRASEAATCGAAMEVPWMVE
jgi:hypothetical protein